MYILYVAPVADIKANASQFSKDSNREFATPDWYAYPTNVPNDPLHPNHGGTIILLKFQVIIGVQIDTMAPTSEQSDLMQTSNLLGDGSQGYGSSTVKIRIGDNDNNPDDNSASAGQGTACSGVAAAIANNGVGVAGQCN